MIRDRLSRWLDDAIRRIVPVPFYITWEQVLADAENDLDAWTDNADLPAGTPPAPPTRPGGTTPIPENHLADWERELRDSFLIERTKTQADIASVAASILRAHNIIGAPIYADLIAEALLDKFAITTRGNHQ